MASLTIIDSDINSGDQTSILADSVVVSGNKNNAKQPNINSDLVEVQTNTHENITFNVTGVHITNEEGTLTWSDVLTLYKKRYSGANSSALQIVYGEDNNLTGLGETTNIKVILDNFRFTIDTKDSKNAYQPKLTLMFSETA